MNEGDELLYIPMELKKGHLHGDDPFFCFGEMMIFLSTQKYAEKLSNIRRWL
jgi:hypothetical protein